MLRSDHLGVTSVIRELNINSDREYEGLLHFFRSKAWKLEELIKKWAELVIRSKWIYRGFGQPVLIGDGVDKSKEGKHMPSVKKLHQKSENSGKPKYIWGHMFGGIGVMIGSAAKQFCLPISMRIHDGNSTVREWTGSEYLNDSHVTRLIREAFKVATFLKEQCFLVLDRYYLSANALLALTEEAKLLGVQLITVVTKAKKSCVAYVKLMPAEKPMRPKRGRKPKEPPKHGGRVKVMDLFTSAVDQFTQIRMPIYGKATDVSYLCLNLLWGDGLFQELRFVLVSYGNVKSILVSTNLLLDPEKIIALYCGRFKIEVLFKAFKQVLDGFGYHFWSFSVPKLNRRDPAKAADTKLKQASALSGQETCALSSEAKKTALKKEEKFKEAVINTYNATEGFVMLCCIAIGILQLVALSFTAELNSAPIRWLRTYTNIVPSEDSTATILRVDFHRICDLWPSLGIVRVIRQKTHPKLPNVAVAA